MMRLIVVAAAAIALILFVAFIAARVVKSRRTGMSIRLQVFLALAAIVGAFAFGLGLMVIDRIEARAVRFASQAARGEANALAEMMAMELEETAEPLSTIAQQLKQREQRSRFSIELRDEQGQVLYARATGHRRGTVAIAAPIIVDGATKGSVIVVKPTLAMERLLTDFAPTVLVISLVLGAAAALAAAWIGRAIAAPIEALSRFAQDVSSGHQRGSPPPIASSREVKRLAHSIDSMRRQLEGRPFVETFAADLSHEMKNPVAAIKASAEVLDDSALDEPDEARRFVRRIQEAVARIERLLGELLSLAQLEARGVERSEPQDVAQLVRVAVDAHDAKEHFELRAEGDTRVRGDRAWLSRAVQNLLDNAMIHGDRANGAAGPNVHLTVIRESADVVFTVENPGSISPHVKKNLFRRFITTRADKGGTGLGLAIVRAVAEAHGGELEMTRPGPPTVAFAITLRAAFQDPSAQLRRVVRGGSRRSQS